MAESNRPNPEQIRNETRSAALYEDAKRNSRLRNPNDAEPAPKHSRFTLRRFRWILRGVLFLAAVLLVLFLLPRIKALFSPQINLSVPDSLSGMLPDETMGYSKIDFSNAILGESRAKSDFVVLEQDVTVTSRVSQALANLALFEKSQVIRSYGTGVYTVDLSQLTEADVDVDDALATVTIRIPHAALAYVTVDLEKTEYEETKKSLFAFGEIKLTSEQTNILEQSIDDAMRIQLDSQEMLQKADVHALSQTQKLFEPVVQAVAPDYIVVVLFRS